jgi:modulator of FtsH protease HflC
VNARALIVGLGILAALMVLWRSAFGVAESQFVIRTHFGQIVRSDYTPGLHFKPPWDRLYRFDRRVMNTTFEGEPFLTNDNRTLSIDFFARWRIADSVRYFNATSGDEATANGRIGDIVKDRLKAQLASKTLAQVVAESHHFGDAEIAQTNSLLKQLGVTLLDVDLQRIDLGDDVANVVYQRMQGAFAAQAKEIQADGAAEAEGVRATADRQRSETLANAVRDAQRIRADADSAAAATYARAYGRNPEFAAFYRSLEAYRNSLGRDGDIFVLSPDSEFFKYLRSPAR